jgi:hypothetical protein
MDAGDAAPASAKQAEPRARADSAAAPSRQRQPALLHLPSMRERGPTPATPTSARARSLNQQRLTGLRQGRGPAAGRPARRRRRACRRRQSRRVRPTARPPAACSCPPRASWRACGSKPHGSARGKWPHLSAHGNGAPAPWPPPAASRVRLPSVTPVPPRAAACRCQPRHMAAGLQRLQVRRTRTPAGTRLPTR